MDLVDKAGEIILRQKEEGESRQSRNGRTAYSVSRLEA